MGSPRTSGSGSLMLFLKAALASAAVVVTTAVMLHAGPPIRRLLATEVPRAYASLVAWLTPPYLYFVLNAIILSIAAASRFHKPSADSTDRVPVSPAEMVVHPPDYMLVAAASEEYYGGGEQEAMVLGQEETVVKAEAAGEEEEVEQELVSSRSSWTPDRTASPEFPTEKPLVSVRLGHRKNHKSTPDVRLYDGAGKALRRVARPRREETLESTWRAITEGRAVPLARHLKKSNMWDTRAALEDAEAPETAAVTRKSETLSDRETATPHSGGGGGESSSSSTSTTTSGVGRGMLRREPSLGQDELNRRVEAFIRKFNEEMRLQRQRSLQQFAEMIDRGSH
ncbi:unnamed protein product [Musa acuminata subsp. malaccensis]|uniref:(wild Malaysian banana) hypothetical protein n=1 Tax=Musa acuminata subsp. malaccensis TaxID=214687 RepID=A0A8D6ZIN0_MUSAM|nr:unnamed protein product [Musa acuminata subsp. malaccensis]